MELKVAITDRFRKTFRSLSTTEQKDIDAAIDTWLKNPGNPSSNFEKLSFMGPNIFSIRTSRAGRVIMAKFDGVYFLLHAEGKQHDKANDWAKNKRIDRNDITGAIQIYTDPVEFKEPDHSSKDETNTPIFQNCTEEQLKTIGVPEGWISKVLSVDKEEDYTNLWSYLPEDAIENLEAVRNGFDIRNLVQQINEEYQEEIKNSTVEQINKQDGLELLTEDESLKEILSKDISVFRYYLHPTQKFLVDTNFRGPVKVTGTAGTGKTVAALRKAKKLVEELPENNKPVFFTTYTRYLIKNIQSMFENAGISGDKIVVTNLHNFAVNYAKELELISGTPKIIFKKKDKIAQWERYCNNYFIDKYSPKYLKEEYEEIILNKHILNADDYLRTQRTGRGDILGKHQRQEIWEALTNFDNFQRSENSFSFEDIIFQLNKYLEQFPDLKPFSHVICDEIQDFSNLELRLLRNIVPEGMNDMFLSGDPFQNIYQKQINFSQSGVQIRGRSFRLRTNYRTTDEIQTLAFNALTDQNFNDFTGESTSLLKCESLIYGEEPQYKIFETQDDEFEYLAQYIKNNFGQIGLHEICFATRKKDDRNELREYLSNFHFPCINLEEIKDLKETEGKIVLSTLHGLKGLEFKNLVIYNLSKETFPYIPYNFKHFTKEQQADYIRSEHALLYVSFSRAISNLIITGTGHPIGWLATN
ncbi:MAG: 3'-5' exonuclease [bacterium]